MLTTQRRGLHQLLQDQVEVRYEIKQMNVCMPVLFYFFKKKLKGLKMSYISQNVAVV